jgi:nucleotide-binding universal stress UspA family protein
LLEDAKRKLATHGIDAETAEPAGNTADAIIALAREAEADLIVVGSRHRRLVERLLFGSVSAELVVKAPCDVLVVR